MALPSRNRFGAHRISGNHGRVSHAAAKTSRWNCLFKLRAAAEGLFRDDFRMEFTYDDVTGKAVMIGNQGVADVEIQWGQVA